jgi:hypothetical protein
MERLPDTPAGSAEAIAELAEVMREQVRARGGSFSSELHRGGLAARLLDPVHLRSARARIVRHLTSAPGVELASVGARRTSR